MVRGGVCVGPAFLLFVFFSVGKGFLNRFDAKRQVKFGALLQAAGGDMGDSIMGMGGGDGASNPLWRERVEFVDLSIVDKETTPTQRRLPLFVLGSPFYPQGNNYLNVFEMRYRTMMFDCAKSDDMFGWVYSDQQTGQIAKIGTMCKIVDRQLLEDGRQYIAFEGVSRFKVKKIVKTLPYLLADVEPNITDEIPEDNEEAKKLERSVYNTLKYYIRLMKTYPKTKNMVITQNAKENRPTNNNLILNESQRRSDFSFSLANMIQLGQPVEGQLLLQTTDVLKRLRAENHILKSAVSNVCDQLIKVGVLTEASKTLIEDQSYNNIDDIDILPPDITIEEEEEEKDEWDLQNAL